MKKIINLLLFVIIFVFFCLSSIDAKTVKKAVVVLLQRPMAEYKLDERAIIKINAKNYNGNVQYRVIVKDLDFKKSYDLYKIKDRNYTGIMNSSKVFSISYRFPSPGRYQFLIYVKRVGVKTNDSYITTGVIRVFEKEKIEDSKQGVENSSNSLNGESPSSNNNSSENNSGNSSETNSNDSSRDTTNNQENSTGQVNSNEGTTGTNNPSTEIGSTQPNPNPTNTTNPNGVIKSLNVTLGNGSILEGNVSGNNYTFDLTRLSNDDTVVKINFVLNKDGVIEIAGKKFNAKANQVLSINVPSDLGLPDNPPPGIQLGNVRQYDSTFSLTFTVTEGSNKYSIGVSLKVK
ncbi:hypothetical protein Q3V94_10840 [Caloramator sp. CAR-1]|uniref:hypothetical protein n=1 Tax=Caloramator sp. CAR-1 TaxID=3062777 RepID=UPI0026E1866C|nr:hypothetical protein [Caloramator sp. CAR-1]MDO6355551.1 hypothetical protein [Caloramator sp. CAR-1]